jgi:imidazolonepropionase-like amidohydrolase
MLAHGVTAVRFMIGTPEHLALRRAVEAGQVVGPQLWVASPQFIGREDVNSRVVTTPEAARAAVADVAAAGYDFVKLTLDLPPPVFDAIAEEAARQGIPVIGHVDPRVGVRHALAAGQHIEHLDNYLETVLADTAPMRTSVSDMGLYRLQNWESLDHVDDAKVEQLARETAASGTYTSPTLALFKYGFALEHTDDEIRALPDWPLLTPKHRAGYLRARQHFWGNPPTAARRQRYVAVRNRLVQAIAAAGGRILAASDTPGWFFTYGLTLHRELEALVAAGLSPYQALAAATVNPAAFFGATAEWGTIEAGKRADLVLVAGNPLEDIRNTRRIEGVSVGGRWLDAPDLQRMVRTAAERLGGP